MRAYATKVVVIFVLFCSSTLIRAGTQSLADGSQLNGAPTGAANELGAPVSATRTSQWTDAAKFIDSGQRLPLIVGRIAKRTPAGFMGMRGKKATALRNADEPSRFWHPQQMASNFDVVNSNYADVDVDGDDLYSAPGEKRAPVGFLGMRGKKNVLLDELQMLYYVQALANLNVGSRVGEADGDDGDERPDAVADFAGDQQLRQLRGVKRVPGGGFLGMRGKRNPPLDAIEYTDDGDVDDDDDDNATTGNNGMMRVGFKRVPAGGFMGMRGKKVPGEIGFFGMRGKKIPVNFRGKFVGVRGKKVPGGVALRGFHAGELAMPELQSAHLVDASAAAASEFSNKRAPSGFHGMRGKKWQLTDDSSLE